MLFFSVLLKDLLLEKKEKCDSGDAVREIFYSVETMIGCSSQYCKNRIA